MRTRLSWGPTRDPGLTDLGASSPVNSLSNVLTLTIAASQNGMDVGGRIAGKVNGAVAEFTLTTDIPAATRLLSLRNDMDNGATAAAVAYDFSGVYVATDF